MSTRAALGTRSDIAKDDGDEEEADGDEDVEEKNQKKI